MKDHFLKYFPVYLLSIVFLSVIGITFYSHNKISKLSMDMTNDMTNILEKYEHAQNTIKGTIVDKQYKEAHEETRHHNRLFSSYYYTTWVPDSYNLYVQGTYVHETITYTDTICIDVSKHVYDKYNIGDYYNAVSETAVTTQ